MIAPPKDELAESRLLGCLLRKPRLWPKVDHVGKTWFWNQQHRTLYEGMLLAVQHGLDGLATNAALELEKSGLYRSGFETPNAALNLIDKLTDSVVSPDAQLDPAEKSMRTCWQARKLIEICELAKSQAHQPQEITPENIMETLSQQLTEISSPSSSHHHDMTKLYAQWAEDVEALRYGRKKTKRVLTGLEPIDKFGGIETGWYTIVAARPKMGKSRLAIRLAYNLLRRGWGCDFYSIELRPQVVTELLAVCASGYANTQWIDPEYDIEPTFPDKLSSTLTDLNQKDLRLFDARSRHINEIVMQTRFRKTTAQDKPVVVIIDYLQILSGPGNSEYERVTEITKRLAVLAHELDVLIVALAQFNRAPGISTPKPHQLRSSGQIEQDCDQLYILHRPGVAEEAEEGQSYTNPNEADVVLALNRHGPTGQCRLHCRMDLLEFGDLDQFATPGGYNEF